MANGFGDATRRRFLTVSGAVALGGAAGCSSPGDASENGETDGTHAVSMEPMGRVEFDGVPERWTALLPSYADMGIALDAGQTLGIQKPERYASHFYDELPGVEYDPDEVATLNQDGVDKELFYELESDVHFMEPNQLIQWYGWDRDDVREVENNLGPFFGNFVRRRSDDWHDYPYYSLYGAFEKIAKVFRREERYRRLKSFRDDFLADVQSRLPEDTPEAMLLYPAADPPEKFYPYRLHEQGVGKQHWRNVHLRDAFAGTDVGHYAGGGNVTIDYETMLEIDPDVLLVRGQEGKDRAAFEDTVVAHLADHPVASRVTAVEDGAVYRGGYLDQGPIISLFQTELAAKRVFADEFTEDELFDRERLAGIVTGDE